MHANQAWLSKTVLSLILRFGLMRVDAGTSWSSRIESGPQAGQSRMTTGIAVRNEPSPSRLVAMPLRTRLAGFVSWKQ
jgi:hypothetical protein